MNATTLSERLRQRAPRADRPTQTQTVGPGGLIQFFNDVLPTQNADGIAGAHYCLTLLPEGQHIWTNDLDELARLTEQYGTRQGIYFGTAAFATPQSRKQSNVLALKALRLDIDAGEKKHASDPQGTYPTRTDALVAVVDFAKAAGLPPTYIVSSGEGLHVYWCLATAVEPAAWKQLAEGLGQLAASSGLLADSSVTTDSARILRPPSTFHKNGKQVSVLRHEPRAVYTAEALSAKLTQPSAQPRQYDLSVNADVLAVKPLQDRSRDAGLVARQCPMMADFAAGRPLAEPVWRACIGVLKFCNDGERLCHDWSALDPRYQRAETSQKWAAYDAGPTRCGKAPQCQGCRHNGKISSPVQLGALAETSLEAVKAEAATKLRDTLSAAGVRPVMDGDGRLNFVIRYSRKGRAVRSVLAADSEAATDALIALAADAGKSVSEKSLDDLKAKLRHEGRQSGDTVPVHTRVAVRGGSIFVDLGPGRICCIDSGGWAVVGEAAEDVPLFRRSAGAGELPDPSFDGNAALALAYAMSLLSERFALDEKQALVVLASLMEWHRTDTPHPIIEVVGAAGSGKSTLADFLLSVVDPAGHGGRVTVGTDGRDIAAAAQQRYILPLDNVGKLDKATSDLLCVVSTGGTLLVRQFYTTGETSNLTLHRGVLVTAVSPACTAPDLQTRVTRLELQARQSAYMAEAVLRTALAEQRPRFLGALYTLLSGALRELPAVRAGDVGGHRMVDLDQMGEAMIAAAGRSRGQFLEAVGAMRAAMSRRTASGDVFLLALLRVLRELSKNPTHERQPSLNAVLQAKSQIAVLLYSDERAEITARPGAVHRLLPREVGPAVPSTERALVDALRRVQPLLAGIGITVQELSSGTRGFLRFDFPLEAVSSD